VLVTLRARAPTHTEFAGFECDVAKLYPPKDTRHRFLRAYVTACGHSAFSDAEVDVLDAWVNRFTLCSHAMWFVWAVVHAEHSEVDEDFVAYAQRRRRAYFIHKREFFPASL